MRVLTISPEQGGSPGTLRSNHGGPGAAGSLSPGGALRGDRCSRSGTKLFLFLMPHSPLPLCEPTYTRAGTGPQAGFPNRPLVQQAHFNAQKEAGSLGTKGRLQRSPTLLGQPRATADQEGPPGDSGCVTLGCPPCPAAGSSAWPESDTYPLPAQPQPQNHGSCPQDAVWPPCHSPPGVALGTTKQCSWPE